MRKTGAIVLAAGLSSRMGAFKPMLPFGNSTVARHLISMLQDRGVDPIVVVTGFRADELRQHLFSMGVRFVKNERYETTQMFDSVRIGIDAIKDECERFMILPIDVPAIMPETLRQVMMIDAPMIRTMCNGEPGHPIMLQTKMARKLQEYDGPGGLRGAMENSGIPITNLEVEDEGIYRDMDTRAQYEELLKWNYKRGQGLPTRPVITICLEGKKVFFGPETQKLLLEIANTGSKQEACKNVGISYSKGSKLLKDLEDQLGYPVVQRYSGGIGGGGSWLNEAGRKLVDRYQKLMDNVQDYADMKYQEYIGQDL